ncbi:hypothetical protein V5O48_004842 [Marasmius crinis-equi]|uniref:Uncharacterized protein n=1 Tax=Marasmius crinis-equi TaxID=585013 RepID=A0ABR3FP62_9AGAR
MHSSILRTARRSLLTARPRSHRYISESAAKIDAAFVEPQAEEPEEPTILTEYPDVPAINRQYLPPKGWQDNQMRRNYGDPLHEQEELHSMWSPDIPTIDPNLALKRFAMAFLGFAGAFMLIKEVGTPEPHFVRRTYPYGGLVKELGGTEENKARVEEEASSEE